MLGNISIYVCCHNNCLFCVSRLGQERLRGSSPDLPEQPDLPAAAALESELTDEIISALGHWVIAASNKANKR